MTDTEKSIRAMENLNMVLSITDSERHAANLAIQALQEKAEREKGCDECNYGCGDCANSGCEKCYKDCSWETRKHHKPKHRFCPHCGRKLVQE